MRRPLLSHRTACLRDRPSHVEPATGKAPLAPRPANPSTATAKSLFTRPTSSVLTARATANGKKVIGTLELTAVFATAEDGL